MALQRLQPKIKKLQELHKDDKQKQTEALMALYKEHGVNPFLSIILLVVQLPILISLYRIILSGLGAGGIGSGLYSFIPAPQTINALFLGILSISNKTASSLFFSLRSRNIFKRGSRSIARRTPGRRLPRNGWRGRWRLSGRSSRLLFFIIFPRASDYIGSFRPFSPSFNSSSSIKHLRDKYGE